MRISARRSIGALDIFSRAIIPFTLPIGKEKDFKGVVDVVHMKAYEFDGHGKAKEIDIPSTGREIVREDARAPDRGSRRIRRRADGEVFREGTLDEADIMPNISKAIAASKLCPVFAVSSTTLVGLQTLLDAIVEYAPAPGDARSRAWQGEPRRRRRGSDAQVSRRASLFRLTSSAPSPTLSPAAST